MKKLNIEKTLLIYIITLPILDILSFVFRKTFNSTISPTTILRPILPIIVIIYIFFKEKFKLKMIIISAIYGIYAIIHLIIFKKLQTQVACGNLTNEMQYIINYTFMVLNLFIFTFIFFNKDNLKLKKYTLITIAIYIVSIYISIITKTYSTTYLEGIGIKGWFESGNSLSSVLIIGLFILFTMIKDKKINKIVISVILVIGVFLLTMIGTRVGLYGFIIIVFLYALFELFIILKNKRYISKKMILIFSSAIIIIVCIVFCIGGETLNRRKYLKKLSKEVVNIETGEVTHITLDLLKIKSKVDNGEVDEKYISKQSAKALNALYDFANKYEIENTNKRLQQIVYNSYLFIYQNDIGSILFGNGLLNNSEELRLEMEIPAFLFNFGIVGFVIYFIPFFAIFIYCLFIGIKNIPKIDVEYLMLLTGCGFVFVLSFFTGVTFFSISSATIIIIINVLLINKTIEIKKNSIN